MLAAAAPVPVLAEARPGDLAAYVRARAADAEGKAERAAAGYATALDAAPGNEIIAIRAYRAAIQAGDYALMTKARVALEQSGVAPPDTALLALAEAIHASDAAATQAVLVRMKRGPLEFLVPVVSALLRCRSDPAGAIAMLDDVGPSVVARHYAAETRALIAIGSGRVDSGVAQLRVLLGAEESNFDLRVNAAQLLIGQGRRDLAESLLAGDHEEIADARAQIGAGIQLSEAGGVSRLFTGLAADLSKGGSPQLSLVMARAALRLDGGNDRGRLLLASGLAAGGARERALAALDGVALAGPYARAARLSRIAILSDAGETAQALAGAAALANAPAARDNDAQRYGDLLTAADRHEEAALAYRRAIDLAGADPDWSLWLQYGSALDQSGQWHLAEPALEKAVSLGPDQPIALNYLGYARLEHGGNPAQARALLERANALVPDNASVLDSLAWAYFLGGDVAKALPLLERAAQSEPANTTINEHLGDAYWRSGRRFEARYAWQAAGARAEASDAARLAAKIANGPARN